MRARRTRYRYDGAVPGHGRRGCARRSRTCARPAISLPASRGHAGTLRPPASSPAYFEYLHYLYRDWGRPAETDGENERALAMLASVAERRPLGRTLVVGAGACRLAYDLHRRHPGTETVVVDVDPLLFAAAYEVVRGGSVIVHEANLEIGELAQGSREWVLSRPAARAAEPLPLHPGGGPEPPFAPGPSTPS